MDQEKSEVSDIQVSQLDSNISNIVYSKLILTIVDSEDMQIGSQFTVTSAGLEGGPRRDACTYAGYEVDLNDIILSEREGGVGKQHFFIKYNSETNTYQLQDMNDGTGTFVRLDKPYTVKNNNIISFGDSHMIVTLENYINPSVTLKFIDGPKINHIYTFNDSDGAVKIGRMADCHIRFDDSSLSRYQCKIHKEEDGWVFCDGDGNKLSTNGSWLFADFPVDIYEGMVFKAGQTLFKCEIK